MVGPITKPSNFIRSWKYGEFQVDYLTCVERVLVGLVKFTLISQFFNQTTFKGMIFSGHEYSLIHVFIASFSYYMYLYFNFSGFCDVVIGLSSMAKVDVEENFNRPLLARNIQDFWARWHITLSNYMNEVIFSPLSVILMRKFDLKYKNYVITFCLFIVFILIGYWHGKQDQYLLFGILQAIAVSCNFLFATMLKSRFGMKGFKTYMNNRFYQAVSTTITFLYMCLSLVIFANDIDALKIIIEKIF